jgi:hypothetical protein
MSEMESIVKAAEKLMRVARELEVASGLLLKALENSEDENSEDMLEEAISIVCQTFSDCMNCPISDYNICDHYEDMECSIECSVCPRVRYCVKKLDKFLEERLDMSFCELVVDPKFMLKH